MNIRNVLILCSGFASLTFGATSVCASAQSATNAAVTEPVSTTCGEGFAEIVAKHFESNGAPLQSGVLKITARRGWEEDRDQAPVSYRTPASSKPVEETTVRIVNGALDHSVCVPYTRVYGARPTRYQLTVTDTRGGADPILTVTADLTQPQYSLDDDGLFRSNGDGRMAVAYQPAPAAIVPAAAVSTDSPATPGPAPVPVKISK